jgi:calcium binding protein 39
LCILNFFIYTVTNLIKFESIHTYKKKLTIWFLTNRKEMFLFGRSKSPQELVKALRELFLQLERGDKKYEKIAEDVTKCISGIKNILYGTNEQEPQTEVIAQLAQEIYNANLIKIMIDNIYRVDFEGKKDIASIFNNLLRRQIGNRSPTVDHIASKPDILFRLINGYSF